MSPPLIDEDEHIAVEGILSQFVPDDATESIEALPDVSRMAVQEVATMGR